MPIGLQDFAGPFPEGKDPAAAFPKQLLHPGGKGGEPPPRHHREDGPAKPAAVDPERPLSDFGWTNLARITEFCRQEGIRLVLFTAPLPSAYVANTENYQAYVDAVRAYAAENGLQYWDFSLYRSQGDMKHMGAGEYSDAHHLNGAGAEIFTAELCEVIARDAAGEDVSALFCDTVEEKLTDYADNTIFMADGWLDSQ